MTTYGELFAGVGGMTMGFEAAGCTPLWHVEIDKYCQTVLRRHWPSVRLEADVTEVSGYDLAPVDILAFGSPCQDLSQAGQRRGFADGHRSVLFHEAIRIIKEMRDATDGASPRWAVWENVGGALNSHGGADFAAALEGLVDAGALVIEWAQLDAQFFGVPQRRRRVFVVACFDPATAGRCPDPLLPLAEGSHRDSVTSREARAEARGAAADGAALYVAGSKRDTANCLTARRAKGEPTWMDDGGIVVYAGGKPAGVANSLTARQGARMPSRLDMTNVAVYTKRKRARSPDDDESWDSGRPAPTLNAFDTGDIRATVLAVDGTLVRRLTPVECERLMGWPDEHTLYGVNEKGKTVVISDNQRGKMIGNGVASPVAKFIAGAILQAEGVQ